MEEMNQLKVFTLEEANKLLPQLTQQIKTLQELRQVILSLEIEIDAIELVTEKDDSGASLALNAKVENYTKTVNRFYAVIDEIHAHGCFLKDLETGLVDFYSLRKGQVIYLCWKLGESKIGFWHEIGKGFSNRQPLNSDSE